ncbi:MAG: hypothetical protein M1483_00290 [Actinobacteria bacterium]|nr:hypothetical protein [Actinomycetota bacterium]MCL6104076.1 hypothetical protein [Actinomycetota bacterium]
MLSSKKIVNLILLILTVVTSIGLVSCDSGNSSGNTAHSTNPTLSVASPTTRKHFAVPPLKSTVLTWSLHAPLSRAVVLQTGQLSSRGGQLTIFGGLTANDTSANGIYTLNTTDGYLTYVGSLIGPLHDAAGVTLQGEQIIFGGGTSSSTAAVQAVTVSNNASTTKSKVIGQLPQPRSDLGAAVISNTAYIIGGYNGTTADATVLSTTNGTTFKNFAPLQVPVRYAALAALNHKIYVFGGQTMSGDPVGVIQEINPSNGTVTIVGQLPKPVTGASAVVLNKVLYIVGGEAAGAEATVTNPLTPVSTILAFNPASNTVITAGNLQVPVSHAGVIAFAGHIWVIGGENSIGPVSTVQMFN